MSFSEKLKRLPLPLGGEGRGEGEQRNAPAARAGPFAARLPGQGFASLPRASREARDFTSPRVEDRIHGPGYRQGRVLVGPAKVARAATVASLALDDTLSNVDASRMLLVDTETTGLHGGSGTLPFVIGLSWFDGDDLLVRQLFLHKPGQERPLLQRLAQQLEQSSLLVTFNGKCFDWPLLRTRFVMNRIPVPPPLPHLDLLHCSRRVFKRRLGATRLQDLERQVLGFERHDDIPGSEIPAVYFEWLLTGRPAAIERVLEHNAQDLISMAAVLAELCRRFEGVHPDDAAEDCLSMARVAERAGQPDRAAAFARDAVERAADAETERDALSLLARFAVRARQWAEAAALLERATRVNGPGAPLAHLVYARVCEHGLKDFAKALKHAELASDAEDFEANVRRVARLTKKLQGTG